MKRLTESDSYGVDPVLKCLLEYDENGYVRSVGLCSDYCKRVRGKSTHCNCDECGIQLAISRLAAYEDTWLSPDEVILMKYKMKNVGKKETADKNRLAGLIANAVNGCAPYWANVIADYLLEHGVMIENVLPKKGCDSGGRNG